MGDEKMLKGINMAIINASHAAFLKRYKTTARIYILLNNIPINYSIPHSLKKRKKRAFSLSYALMYKIIFKLQTKLNFLYQFQNTLDCTTRNGQLGQ
jgi:hypothetical protein